MKHQNYKYDNGECIDKDKLMTLALNKYENLCTKDKWLGKSSEEEKIFTLSYKLEIRNTVIINLPRH